MKSLIAAILLMLIMYSAFAFYFMSFNPYLWGASDRGVFASICIIGLLLILFINAFPKD